MVSCFGPSGYVWVISENRPYSGDCWWVSGWINQIVCAQCRNSFIFGLFLTAVLSLSAQSSTYSISDRTDHLHLSRSPYSTLFGCAKVRPPVFLVTHTFSAINDSSDNYAYQQEQHKSYRAMYKWGVHHNRDWSAAITVLRPGWYFRGLNSQTGEYMVQNIKYTVCDSGLQYFTYCLRECCRYWQR